MKNSGTSRASTTEMSSILKTMRYLIWPFAADAEPFHEQRLRAALRLAPITESTLSVAAIVFCALFWQNLSHALMLSWAAAAILTNMVWYGFGVWRERSNTWEATTRLDAYVAVWHAAVRSALWTIMIVYLFGRADADHRLFLASFSAGLIGAGAYSLGTLRKAVFVWVLVITVGGAYALIATGNTVFLIVCFFLFIYAGIMLATSWYLSRTFIARHQAEADADQQRQVVELLLHDFEASASDWLWETDTDGHLRYVSLRMSEVIGRPINELLSSNLMDFISQEAQSGEFDSTASLGQRLSLNLPFRDCIISLNCHDRARWIALSAKPLLNADGIHEGWRGVGSDITERIVAEEELRNSYAQVRALASALESTREQERERLAREIHDEFGQILAALRIDTSWIRQKAQDRVPEIASRAKAMAEMIEHAQQATKRMSSGLRPRVLDDLGLVSAIRALVNEFSARHDIACDIQISDDGKMIVDPVATPLYRMTQEALTNVAKHAGASKVRVELVTGHDSVILIVADNGKGITESDQRKPGSFGLIGMRQRASAVGGELSVSDSGGEGTTIEIRLPLIEPPG